MVRLKTAFVDSWEKLKWLLLVLGLLLLLNLLTDPAFFEVHYKDHRLTGTLVDIGKQASRVMLLSLGMTLVIATGGVDLSVGAVMAIAGAIAARWVAGSRAPEMIGSTGQFAFPIVLILSLCAGCASGFWNGVLVSFVRVQPIVATLILMVAGRGIAQLINHGQIVTFENPSFAFVGSGYVLGVPFSYWLVAFSFAVIAALMRFTALGLFVESTGDNETASLFSGVNTKAIKCFAYVTSGLFAALAGLLAAADIKGADASTAGLYLELDAILAVVIGGTVLTGGRFYLFNSLVGAIFLQALTTTILRRNVPTEYTQVVKGAIIIIVCLAQSEKFRALVFPNRKRLQA
jgi:ribose/xylose/arabinose/galactoside ABC-type transport system permease subunit